MLLSALALSAALPSPARAQDLAKSMAGVWKLTSYIRQEVASGETSKLFGDAPPGYAHYTPGGRFLIHFTRQHRTTNKGSELTDAESLEAFKTMVSWAGTYRTDGDKVFYQVEVAYVPSWVGTVRTSRAQVAGNTLTVTTLPFKSRLDGKDIVVATVWERQEYLVAAWDRLRSGGGGE
jgi:hypothetical protein